MSVSITFLGAAGTVTGSKYLVEADGKNILIDCGMFQGDRVWRERNWDSPAIKLNDIHAVLITHAHIDHIGVLPRYVSLGLNCPVFCSAATADLTRVMLLDSAHLQEEEANYRNTSGRSRHHPALPLYTTPHAEAALGLIRRIQPGVAVDILPGVKATWRRMGHIIGACSITLEISGRVINFSGDIGRYTVPILHDPEPMPLGDLLLIESTYGDRQHPAQDPKNILAEIINKTIKRNGVVVIPAFAVGRTQNILFDLREAKHSGLIPDIPVVVDSPMASDATAIYKRHVEDYDESALGLLNSGREPFKAGRMAFVTSRDESIKLNRISDPMIIISASGMLTGGRVLHHLKNRVGDPRNTVVLVGFQPPGGRGAWLKSGAKTMRLFGEEVAVQAEIEEVSGLSAHADRAELLRWCASCSGVPGRVAVVHGEPEVSKKFAETLRTEQKWEAAAPNYLDKWKV